MGQTIFWHGSTRFDGVTSKDGSKDGVATTALAYDRMSARWELTDDLRGGSDAMRDKGIQWLPKEDAENFSAEYRDRLGRSFLLGAYDDTIEKLASKPFSRPVTLNGAENLGEKLALIEGDVDLQGRNLTTFMAEVFEEGLHRGLTHVLVDYPSVGEGLSLADEREAGLHPYFVHVRPPELIAWRWRVSGLSGEKQLAEIRMRSKRLEIDGQWGERLIDIVRVVTAPAETPAELAQRAMLGVPTSGYWQVWRKDPNEDDDWRAEGDPVPHSFDGIPLVTLYFKRIAPMEGRPPLWDLAEKNLEHWQKSSDQNNILHVARVPIALGTGVSEEERESKPIVVGGNRIVWLTSKDANLRYVEHGGEAIGAGKEDLDSIRQEMEVMGLQPLMRRANATLATAIISSEGKEASLLQAWARRTEEFATKLYGIAGEWVGEAVPDDFGVNIFNEFGVATRGSDDLDTLTKARKEGDLSRQTYLEELKRRGTLAETVDVDEEEARIEEETADETPAPTPPGAGRFGGPGAPGAPPDQPGDSEGQPDGEDTGDAGGGSLAAAG